MKLGMIGLIDGDNSFYRDDLRRAEALAPRGIGWIWGSAGESTGWKRATA